MITPNRRSKRILTYFRIEVIFKNLPVLFRQIFLCYNRLSLCNSEKAFGISPYHSVENRNILQDVPLKICYIYVVKGKCCQMANEVRTVCYDPDLQIEAYRFEGVKQKFPNHFHDYYVIGFIEKGKRLLVCSGRESIIRPGDILLFNPGDNHTCRQISEEALDYRCLNIQPDVMRKTATEIQGTASLPTFRENVAFNSDLADSLRELHRMIANRDRDFKKEEIFQEKREK